MLVVVVHTFFPILRRSILSSSFRLPLFVFPSPIRTGTILPRSENTYPSSKWCDLMSSPRFLSKVCCFSLSITSSLTNRIESNQIESNNQFGCACIEAGLNFFPIVPDRSNIVLEELFNILREPPVTKGVGLREVGVCERNSQNGCFYQMLLPFATTFDVPGFSWDQRPSVGCDVWIGNVLRKRPQYPLLQFYLNHSRNDWFFFNVPCFCFVFAGSKDGRFTSRLVLETILVCV